MIKLKTLLIENSISNIIKKQYPNIVLNLYEKNNIITLSKIVIPKENRNQGIGTKIMNKLCDYADKNNKTIVLTTSVDFGATSIQRLIKFYKSFGFVSNTKKNRDFSISDSMYRLPKSKVNEYGALSGMELTYAENEPHDWTYDYPNDEKKTPSKTQLNIEKTKKYISKISETINDIPQILYHATYKPYLKSIKKFGLDPSKGIKNWDFSKDVIYLSTDAENAESFAETAESVPDEYLDEIIVLQIDTNKINKNLLHFDENVNDEDNTSMTYEYHGIIPIEAIKIL